MQLIYARHDKHVLLEEEDQFLFVCTQCPECKASVERHYKFVVLNVPENLYFSCPKCHAIFCKNAVAKLYLEEQE